MSQSIKNRLKRAERGISGGVSEALARALTARLWFDELPQQLQREYRRYIGVSEETAHTIADFLDEPYSEHFRIEWKHKPTAEELRRNREEVEEWLEKCIKEYNEERRFDDNE